MITPCTSRDHLMDAGHLACRSLRCRMSVRARTAFTLIEVTVSIGLLLLAMITVAGVLHLSTEAAGRTAAHTRVIEASTALQHELTDKLGKIVPGLLIIESPPPTIARVEVSGGPQYFRLRRDRLVFIASQGGEGAFESFTDPTRGTPLAPKAAPATASEALMYFGPGIPVIGDGTVSGMTHGIEFGSEDVNLKASEWMFLHRAILFLQASPPVAGWVPPDMSIFSGGGGMLDGGDLSSTASLVPFYNNQMDAVVPDTSAGGLAASGSALIDHIKERITVPGAFASMFHGASATAQALWQPSLAPVSVTYTNESDIDFYARSGATFSGKLADFAIEWTDGGRVDPLGPDNVPNSGDEDLRTRWFGLAPDVTDTPDITNPDGLKFQARLRGVANVVNPSNPNPANPDNDPSVSNAFFNRIEWSPNGITPNVDARYRAVWVGADFDEQIRPKALRFTYRIYDATNRLTELTTLDLNEDGIPDPDAMSTPYSVRRWGQEFSVVVPLP